MERSGEGDYYERLEERELQRLPHDVRVRWEKALSRKSNRPLPFSKPTRGRLKITYKPLSRQARSSLTTFLTPLNLFIRCAASRGIDPSFLEDAFNPYVLTDIFESDWAHLNGQGKFKRCRALWRLAWELYDLALPWILVGGRRMKKRDGEIVKFVDPELVNRLRQEAINLLTGLQNSESEMQFALSLRTAAYILLIVDLGPRLSECALIKMLQVDDEGKTMYITIDARHSKGRKNGREKVSPEAADAIRKYLKSGRPILLNGSHDNEERALWISEDGLDAEAQCMAAALRRRTLGVVPGGAAANAIRRSKLSKEGQTLAEMAQQARQAYGSKTAALVYTVRDRATAVREGQSLSTLSLDDV